MHTILLTGGAGFIGSHLTRLFITKYPQYKIVNLDKLTYAGNLENLEDIEDKPNYHFVKGDITNLELLRSLFKNTSLQQYCIALPKAMWTAQSSTPWPLSGPTSWERPTSSM